MTVLNIKAVTVVLVSSVFLRIAFGAAAECDLEKIFRTPKDMSNVNFDHFEIVERNGFDRSDDSGTTTDAPPESKSKKSPRNVANAQVLVRFGGDDLHGSNHIMKIPPQCRHVFGKEAATHYYHHPPPYAYPPPCPPHHYYHPYPPPVPFTFPNYYFCQYGDEIRYLPPQLRQYFQRHRLNDLNSEQYLNNVMRNRKAAENRPVHEDLLHDNVRPESVLTRPRILKPLNLSNEDIEEKLSEKNDVKRDCSCAESKSEENEIKRDEDAVKEAPKKHHKKHKKSKNKDKISKQDKNDLEKLLDEALVMYKCQNCSSPPKMLVSYPIIHRDHDVPKPVLPSSSCTECTTKKFNNDIDSLDIFDTENIKDECKCTNCQCHKRNDAALGGKKFAHDVDDLMPVLFPAEHYSQNVPPLVPIPQLTKMLLDEADARQKAIQFPSAKPEYLLTGHSTFSDKASSSFYSQTGNSPAHISHEDYAISSGAGYKSDPHSFVIYREPTEIKAASINRNVFPVYPKTAPVPEPTTIVVTTDIPIAERYLPERPQAPSINEDIVSLPYPFPGCYFYPQAHDSARREIERQHLLPKYLKVIPRDDLQIVSPQDSETCGKKSNDAEVYCRKCRHHAGDGHYCVNCGVIFYAVPSDGSPVLRCPDTDHNLPLSRCSPASISYPNAQHGSYCLTCPRETRQLNEW